MFTEFRTALRPAVSLLVLLTLLTGLAYPLLVTGIAQVAVPSQREWQPDRGRAAWWSARS